VEAKVVVFSLIIQPILLTSVAARHRFRLCRSLSQKKRAGHISDQLRISL